MLSSQPNNALYKNANRQVQPPYRCSKTIGPSGRKTPDIILVAIQTTYRDPSIKSHFDQSSGPHWAIFSYSFFLGWMLLWHPTSFLEERQIFTLVISHLVQWFFAVVNNWKGTMMQTNKLHVFFAHRDCAMFLATAWTVLRRKGSGAPHLMDPVLLTPLTIFHPY